MRSTERLASDASPVRMPDCASTWRASTSPRGYDVCTAVARCAGPDSALHGRHCVHTVEYLSHRDGVHENRRFPQFRHRRWVNPDRGSGRGVGVPQGISPDINPQQVWNAFVRPKETWSPRYALGLFAELSVFLGIPFLVAWTPICLIVQFTRPRASWRRLSRQPGFVACLITTTVIALTIVAYSMSVWLSIRVATSSSPDRFIRAYLLGGILAGSGVLWSWLTMRLCGVCRPRPSWTDRLGRLTGVAWVAIGASSGAFIILAIT